MKLYYLWLVAPLIHAAMNTQNMTAGTFEFFIIENVIPANTPQKHSMNLQLQSYFFIPREIVLLIKKMKKGIKVQKNIPVHSR